jgi:hypothetical protein
MVHPYIVNTINALVLIILGFMIYFLNPARTIVALVVPFFGILLLAATYHLRKHNRFVFHTVAALTLLAGLLLLAQQDLGVTTWSTQSILLLIMGLSCFISVGFYVGTFVRERRLGDKSVYKDDL